MSQTAPLEALPVTEAESAVRRTLGTQSYLPTPMGEEQKYARECDPIKNHKLETLSFLLNAIM